MRALAAFFLLVFAHASAASDGCAAKTVYLVRHAEKAVVADEPDPGLSELGQRSAQALRDWFEGKPLDAIYTTHLRRTQQTALPLAGARDLDLLVLPASDTARLLARLKRRHCGGHVLVVGHSNTVPEIAAAWGAEPFEIAETEFGWVYSLRSGQSAPARERYVIDPVRGEPAKP